MDKFAKIGLTTVIVSIMAFGIGAFPAVYYDSFWFVLPQIVTTLAGFICFFIWGIYSIWKM